MIRNVTTATLTSTLSLVLLAASPAAAKPAWTAVTSHYETIRQALVNDSLAGVAEHATMLGDEIEALRGDLTAARAGVPADSLAKVEGLLPEAAAAAGELAAAGDLAAARDAFYALTKPLVRWRQAAGSGPAVAYCTMLKRSWLQPAGTAMGNPYYGRQMADCGEIVGKS